MTSIRPLRREEIPQAAALFDKVMGSGTGMPAPGLEEFFARTMFDHPWADPELPSLASVEDGRVAGFLGSNARRLQFDGRPTRLAVSGPLVVDPQAPHPALGALLLRKYLDGPQDLTITDGATELVRVMWERLHGETAHLRCIEWVRPLRPITLAAAYWRHRRKSTRAMPVPLAKALGALDRVTDPAVSGLLRIAGSRAEPPVLASARTGAAGVSPVNVPPPQIEPLTPAALVEHLPRLTEQLRLSPAYDRAFSEWLFDELAQAPGRGQLVARLVRRGLRVAGWFIYYLQPGGFSPVVQVAAANEVSARTVFEALLAHARDGGAAALHGRVETHLLQAVAACGAFMAYGGNALIHSSDPAIVAIATSPHALLTRLEGERWMAPQRF